MKLATVILAAGFGTRMRSELPKVLHPVAGRPMVEWAVCLGEAVSQLPPIVVVGHGKERVQALLGQRVEYAVQSELLGTGHAVRQAEHLLRGKADAVLVIYADTSLLQVATIQNLITLFENNHTQPDFAMAMLTVVRDDAQGFGRVIRNAAGEIQEIIEEVDCTPEQKAITELNPGIYCFDNEWLWDNLSKIPLSKKGEYYLTDMVGIATAQNRKVATTLAPLEEVNGINTRVHLALAEQVIRRRINEKHMLAGVTLIDPETTYIEDTVEIGSDTTVLPGCLLQGNTRIGANSQIGPHSQIIDSEIGNYCRITYSVMEKARLEDHCEIGPFGRLRPGAHLAEGVHMGNFGEVKNSYLGPGTKMGHFSYIGDTHIEATANIGAGTITCNYDGQKKSKTVIGKDVFIGSDTLLVAPVTLGDHAMTGAGSVVTKDVPANTLVYGVPARQANRNDATLASDSPNVDVTHDE
ncbi:MAG: bifunctional UDP-N-acetylglucosamine diphosphorylase/glucosamine-1-phosphate N-acetyltransferase GlmU [Chloroflexi bacterium]|nr:bifunctional UDP-N-acetylglucosamine diphosphorylase/glucosamine-1-phosphate N-acetyltransferase GlmU [Chloroflexota bacterium]